MLYGLHISIFIPVALIITAPLMGVFCLYFEYIENKYGISTENLFAIPKIKKIHKEYSLDNL